jgi:lipopolysaccharide biosynthesis glycosyltransferase
MPNKRNRTPKLPQSEATQKRAGQVKAKAGSSRQEPAKIHSMRSEEDEKTALVVLGMHRSGTSALARVLNLLGADLPKNLMSPMPDNNPEGFWEPIGLVHLHDQMLRAAGTTWDDPGLIPEFWKNKQFIRPFQEKIVQIIKNEYGDSSLFVVKDPRITRFIPVTMMALRKIGAQPKLVIAIRNPLEVAASLKARDGFHFAKSLMLWLDHTLHAERATRKHDRTFVLYDRLVKDWGDVVHSLAADLKLDFPDRSAKNDVLIESFISKAHQHHEFTLDDIDVHEDVTEWVKLTYKTIRALADGKSNAGRMKTLDRILTAFTTAQKAFGPILAQEQLEIRRLTKERDAASAEATKYAEIAERLVQDLDESQSEAATLRERTESIVNERDSACAEYESLRVRLAETDKARDALAKVVAENARQLDRLENELQDAQSESAAPQASAEAITKEHDSYAEYESSRTKLEEIAKARDDQAAELNERDAEINDLSTKLQVLKEQTEEQDLKLKERSVELEQRSKELTRRDSEIKYLKTNPRTYKSKENDLNRKIKELDAKLANRSKKLDERNNIILGDIGKVAIAVADVSLRRGPRIALRLFRDLRIVLSSHAFDVDFYLRQNPDVSKSRIHPVIHYLRYGTVEGRDPIPLFDTGWYLKQNPDVAASGVNPLVHYLRFGSEDGRKPNPLFDGKWYLEQNRDVAEKELDPLLHYLGTGAAEGRRPHPLFDTRWYLKQYLDVAEAGVNPLIHFIEHGWREGRNPNPFFDVAWYLANYPDVAEAGVNPLVHYLGEGSREGRNPSARFDTKYYIEANKDVADAGINPLAHYLTVGCEEGRNPAPLFLNSPYPSKNINAENVNLTPPADGDSRGANVSYMALRQEVLDSGLWDEKWYLSKYYEHYINSKRKRTSGEHFFPLDYYLLEGWKLGHEPSSLLPIQIDQKRVGCSKIEYFLDRIRFAGYQFDENCWTPSQKRIEEFLKQKQHRKSTKVVYTCIVQHYDELMQPYYISADWDYVCFTDSPDLIRHGIVGVWEIRPLSDERLSATKRNRWHKMHPHILFPTYEESIYVDGNINILTNYIFDQITKRDSCILLPQHFRRNCTYHEIEALLNSHRISDEDKSLLIAHRRFLEHEGFPKEFGLSENNLIYRRHHDDLIVKLMREWWEMYELYSSRDQASMAYVFWKNDMSLHEHMYANCRVNYKDFWVVKHLQDRAGPNYMKRQALTPAFDLKNVAVVFSTNEHYIPYLGVAIYSLIENASDDYNYDIVILARGLEAALAKIFDLARGRGNVSIRVYDTTALIESLPTEIFHVEGYVPIETYNKCFITEILSGYVRCVYLDSDIVVLDDIQKLHDIDLEGHAVGVSVNVANVNAAYCRKVIKERRFDEYLERDLGILDHSKYFQAGVVVLDMEKLGARNMRQLTLETLAKIKKPIFFDQCIFNRIFYGDVYFFSTRWNHVWYMQQYSYLRGSVSDDVFFDYAHGRIDPKIIHYAGQAKPQNLLGRQLSDKFWKYAYASPFFDDIRKDILEQNNEIAPILLRESSYEWSRLKPRVLVHLHLYYVDQLGVMINALKNVTDCNYDLFVTMPERNEAAEERILSVAEDARFCILPNVGYDVFPFLHVLKQARLANYDFVLKIHTKNARSPGQDEVYSIKVPGFQWRDELLGAIVGSKDIFRNNIARLVEDKKVGCIGAEQFIFSTEDNNEERTYSLEEWRKKCGVVGGHHYVGGSMFLARAYPFERLKGLNVQPEDFESDHMATKDYKNKAHVFERLFGIVIENEGFNIIGVDQKSGLMEAI